MLSNGDAHLRLVLYRSKTEPEKYDEAPLSNSIFFSIQLSYKFSALGASVLVKFPKSLSLMPTGITALAFPV